MNGTPSPALVAGAGFSLVDSIYAASPYENLNEDALYTAAMLRVLRDTYCLTGTAPHPSLTWWLMEGQHSVALSLLLTHDLIDVDLLPTVRQLLTELAVLETR